MLLISLISCVLLIRLIGQDHLPFPMNGALKGMNLTRTILWSVGIADVQESQWCVFISCLGNEYIQFNLECEFVLL